MGIFNKEIHGYLDILVILLRSFISCSRLQISLSIVRPEGSTDWLLLLRISKSGHFSILLMIFMWISIMEGSRPSMIKIDLNLHSNDEGQILSGVWSKLKKNDKILSNIMISIKQALVVRFRKLLGVPKFQKI